MLKSFILLATLVWSGGVVAVNFDREMPPEPRWDDGFGPGGPGGPRDRDRFRDGVPPPEPRDGPFGPRRDIWVVCGLVSIPSLVLLVLLSREMSRGRREVTTKLSLLSSVSHEFRTPLTNLKLYAELLESAPDLPVATREKYLKIISDETARLDRLVSNVLDFGRLAESRRVYALHELDLPRLVRDIAAKQHSHLEGAGMSLEIEGDEELTVQGDADAIRQVVNNLIDNAVKYAADGKVVRLVVGRDGGRPFVDVVDRGPGVAKKNVKHLFDRFWRAETSLASGASGCGLGLDISRGLMRGMGGDLVYRDNPEGGGIFRAVFHG